MDINSALSALKCVDPDTLSEAELRALVPRLFSLCEALASSLPELAAQILALQNEISRLKGEHGKRPRTGSGGKGSGSGGKGSGSGGGEGGAATGHSTEAERHDPKPWEKGKRLESLVPDREEPLRVPREGLPSDVVSKGFVRHVAQELVVRRETVAFLREKLYSPSQGKTWLAPLPPGFKGGFGPGLRGFCLQMAYGANVSFGQIHSFLTQHGIGISRGKVSGLLTRDLDALHGEAAEVLRAGLESSAWQGMDVTATPLGGEWRACHILSNPAYTAYRTAKRQTRMEILATLRGGRPAQCLLDGEALKRLEAWGTGPTVLAAVGRLQSVAVRGREELEAALKGRCPRIGAKTLESVLDAAEISAYRVDPEWPAVTCLLADDAAQLREITEELSLCWVHDGRHYKKLQPQFHVFRKELEAFRGKYWAYYRKLLAYKEAPSPEAAQALETEFDSLFSTEAGFEGLATCIARTRANKAKLLMVLKHPELPLHNNASELAARTRVVKRRVSHGPKTEEGARVWDTMQTLAATAAKQGVRYTEYLADRIRGTMRVPWLPDAIRRMAERGNLSRSWCAA